MANQPPTTASTKLAALLAMADHLHGEMIGNLETRLISILAPEGGLPATLNDGTSPTCYLCCPSVAYIDYALAELRNFSARRGLKFALGALLAACRPLMKATGLDCQIQPNNWLIATNLPPDIDRTTLENLTRQLVQNHPGRAIVWRSLNELSDAALLRDFAAADYRLLPARQIYLFDCRTAPPPMARDERRDMALLHASDYAFVEAYEIGPEDYPRMAELYAKLYLDKYTSLNPRYTAHFMEAAHRGNLLTFFGLRRGGRLDGIIGFFEEGAVMSAPVVGYDTSVPQELGLYRRLMAIGMHRARQGNRLYNMSAGAAGFKRNRSAVPAIEYSAVYVRHLSPPNKAATRIVEAILNLVGKPLLKRFEL